LGFVDRRLERTRHVLSNLFDKASPEESAARLDGSLRIHIHGVLLPVAENQETLGIHDDVSSIHDPTHFPADHRLCRQWPGKIIHKVPRSLRVKYNIVRSKLSLAGNQILRVL